MAPSGGKHPAKLVSSIHWRFCSIHSRGSTIQPVRNLISDHEISGDPQPAEMMFVPGREKKTRYVFTVSSLVLPAYSPYALMTVLMASVSLPSKNKSWPWS